MVFDVSPVGATQTRTLRVVTYNIEDDINGATTPLPGLIAPPSNTTNVQAGGVLEGIGEEILGSDPAQPLDVLALQETTGNPITVAPIVNGLNSFYNAPGMYAMSPYQATESGGDVADGNGPNALVYNTKTLQLLASVPVDPRGGTNNLGSSSGEYREVMRYELAPAGMTPTATNEFYIYVSHYKSGTSSSDLTYRNGEAQIIRTNEAIDLPANARVLYVGDFNITTSGEASYQTILSNTAPNGIHQGQGIDPLNPTNNPNINWGTSTTATNILAMETESATDLRYRDDLQVMTTNVYFGVAGGLALVPGTYHVFGNNGTTPYYGSVNSGSDTALNSDLASGGAHQRITALSGPHRRERSPARGGRLHHPHHRAGAGVPIGDRNGRHGDVHLERDGQCGLSTAIPHESGSRQLEQFGERHHRDQRRHVRCRFHRAGPAAVLSSAGAVRVAGGK